jgi:hypothetical protein
MGWANGSDLLWEIIAPIKKSIPNPKTREKCYRQIIEAFSNQDCDTLSECYGADPVFDRALRQWEYENGDSDEG